MVMTASQIAAELQRKKNLGIAPTNAANNAAYNKLSVQKPTSAIGTYLNSSGSTGASTPTTSNNPTTNTSQPSNPSAVSSYMQSQQPPTFTPYQPFEYTQANIEADPQYQAALATAKQNIQTGQNNTIANLVANGQGHSSYADTVTQQIANKELANVNNNILPQLIQQAYQRHQQDFANQNLLDQQNYGVTQDAFNNAITEGQLTGNYQSPEQRSVISQILALKQQAEAPGVTAQQRAGLSSQADELRDRLTALGGNASAVGANVSAAGVNPFAGQRTLAGQQFDQGVKQANLGAAIDVSNLFGRAVTPQDDYTGLFRQGANPNTPLTAAGQAQQFGQGISLAGLTGTLPDGTKTTAEQQRQLENLWQQADLTGTIPDQLATLYGIPKGTQTQAAKQFAEENLRQYAQLGITASKSGSSAQNVPSSSVAGDYLKGLITTEKAGVLGGPSTKVVAKDYATRKQAFEDMYNTLFAGTDADSSTILETLTRAGYSPSDIKQLKKDYPDAFNNAETSSGGGFSGSVKVPQQYQSVINSAQEKYGLSGSNILAKIAKAESSFNPNAKSPKGAEGLFQFIPSTAKAYGIDPYNVTQAADAAGKLISGLLAKYDGDYAKALAGYNAGGGKVDKLIDQYGDSWLAHAPTETKDYIKKILG